MSTSLQRALEAHKITYYELARLMGGNPLNDSGEYKKKATGKSTMTYEELKKICLIITMRSKKPFTPKDLTFQTKRLIAL